MAYSIQIRIEHYDKAQAIELLKRTLSDIEKGIIGISEHNDTYMPYRYFSCHTCAVDEFKNAVNKVTTNIITKYLND